MLPYDISIQYMIGGYAVILTILAIYIISLAVRWKNLKRTLQALQEEEK